LADSVGRVDLPHPIRVAVDGRDAVGKTTLADELAERLRLADCEVIRASIDGFHRPRTERYCSTASSSCGRSWTVIGMSESWWPRQAR
jgi:uridine kinase